MICMSTFQLKNSLETLLFFPVLPSVCFNDQYLKLELVQDQCKGGETCTSASIVASTVIYFCYKNLIGILLRDACKHDTYAGSVPYRSPEMAYI